MTLLDSHPSAAFGPPDEGAHAPVRRGLWPEDATAEDAFAAILAHPSLSPFDKVVVAVLADFCRSSAKVICWPSNTKLAEKAGAAGAKDGGVARVRRSLARLEQLGIVGRVDRRDFAAWMESVGRPQLGLATPRPKGNPYRFLVLRWKAPSRQGAGAHLGRAQAPISEARQGACAHLSRAPAPISRWAPAPPLRTCSNLERSNGTSNVNVNAAPPGGETPGGPAGPVPPPPPAAPVLAGAEVEAYLARLANPHAREFEKKLAACVLGPAGLLPAEFSHLATIDLAAPAPAPVLAPRQAAPAPAGPSTVENLIRRVAEPGRPERAPERAREIAARMAEEWSDYGSLNGFIPRLLQAATGQIPVRVVVGAYQAARKCGPGVTKGKIFHATINRAIGGAGP